MDIIKPGTHIDFLSKSRLFGMISAGVVVVSIALIFVIGPNLGIDFRGGTNIIVRFHQSQNPQAVTQAMVAMGYDDALVQSFGADDENQFLIQTNRISTIDGETAEQVRSVLTDYFGDQDFQFVFNVDAGDRIEIGLPETAFDHLDPDWVSPLSASEDSAESGETDQDEVTDEESEASAQAAAQGPTVSLQIRYLQWLLEDAGLEHPRISQVGNPRQNRFLIRLQQIQSRVQEGLVERFGDSFSNVDRVETVGPRVGRQLRNDGIKAMILSLFFILVYIGLRFNMRFAPAAVITLFHDVLFTFGVLIILQEEITLTILAAMLTIVGYSLNDTIVVFDRIRENLGTLRTKDLKTVANQSINECLSRTVVTSLTTMLAVLAIYFLGGGLIQSFALCLIIGIIIGTYSSIYVATPAMIWLHDRLEERAAREREEARAARRPTKARRST